MKQFQHAAYTTLPAGLSRPDARVFNPLFLLTVFLWLLVCMAPAGAEAKDNPKVLVLHSYHQGYLWTDMIQEGVSRPLTAAFPKVELYVEYMNTKRQGAESMSPHLVQLYRQLYRNTRFDVIIASDNNALDFLLSNRDALFPGVPVVFCGINNISTYRFNPAQNYTGVSEDLDIVSTIQVALKLHSGTKKIAIVTDDTESGQINLGLARGVAARFPSISFLEFNRLTASALRSQLGKLDDSAVVLAL